MESISARLELLQNLKRYTDGAVEARAVIASNPDWARGYAYLSMFLRLDGYLAEAREVAFAALAKDPSDAWLQVVMSDAQDSLGRYRERDAALREAIRFNPEYTVPHAKLGVYLLNAGQHRQAKRVILEGLSKTPEEAELHRVLGWAELKLGRFDFAVSAAERALALQPDSATLHYSLAVFLRRRGRPQDAMRAASAAAEAVRIEPLEREYRDELDRHSR